MNNNRLFLTAIMSVALMFSANVFSQTDVAKSQSELIQGASPQGPSLQGASPQAVPVQGKPSKQNALPENSERLLPSSVFQFWGLPELPGERLDIKDESLVATKDQKVAREYSKDLEPIRFEVGSSFIRQYHLSLIHI